MGRELRIIGTWLRAQRRLRHVLRRDPPVNPRAQVVNDGGVRAIYALGVSKRNTASLDKALNCNEASVSVLQHTALLGDVVEIVTHTNAVACLIERLQHNGLEVSCVYDPQAAAMHLPEPHRSTALATLLKLRHDALWRAVALGQGDDMVRWCRVKVRQMRSVMPYLIRGAMQQWDGEGDLMGEGGAGRCLGDSRLAREAIVSNIAKAFGVGQP